MNRQELLKHLSDTAEGIGKGAAGALVDELASVAAQKLLELGEFSLPGIGKLKLTVRAARIGRNPQTGVAVEIPEKKAVKFVAAKQLKDTATA